MWAALAFGAVTSIAFVIWALLGIRAELRYQRRGR